MRYFLGIGLLLQLFLYSHSQTTPTQPLHFESFALALNVTNNENLVLSTKAGEVALTLKYNQPWKTINPVKEKEIGMPGVTIEQASFFNRDTGFVSGFISNGSEYNIIYHTSNGGNTYQAINFGQSGWIDNAVNLNNGEAWLSVAGSGIAYTNDFGYTWKKLAIPERKQRFTSIYFNPARQGIIGSLWNMMAITNNNCASWTTIPTPLDQKKYTKTNNESRPEVEQVAIFHNYILCMQGKLIFYSSRDSVNWRWLPAYDNFYTDAENSALYFKAVKGTLVKVNDQLEPVFTFENVYSNILAKYRNGKLFIKKEKDFMVLKPDNTIVSAPLLTPGTAAEQKPIAFGFNGQKAYGAIGNDIFLKDAYNSGWEPFLTLPFAVDQGQLSLMNDSTIACSFADTMRYFDLLHQLTKVKSKRFLIENFCATGISQLVFGSGSSGCFHYDEDELIFDSGDDGYDFRGQLSNGSRHKTTLTNNVDFIDAALVDDFLKQLPQLIDKKATIADLGFTEDDYTRCRQDISDFQSSLESKKQRTTVFTFDKNNLDFNRLNSMVDSIKTLHTDGLNTFLFNLSEIWSTTTNWVKLKLVNKEGEVMQITSSFYAPPPFYFPWQISIDGYHCFNTSVEISRFIRKACPGLLGGDNKRALLHAIVKRLY